MKNIYLEPDEEIISVIDRLVQADTEQVNIIIPAGAQIWQSSINLKLLKREADNLKKDVTLVVSSNLNIEMAEKIGFAAKRENDFSAELAAQKSENQPKKKKDMLDFLASELEAPTIAAKETRKKMADIVDPSGDVKVNFFRGKISKSKPTAVKKIYPISPASSITGGTAFSRWPKVFAVFIALAFMATLAVGYLVLPTTEVFVFPKKEKITFDLLVIGSKNISHPDEGENKIPLREIEVEKTKSGEFSATGEKELNKRASGFIIIYNEYSSKPQPLVTRTRFESPDGKVFRIVEGVTVPGAKIEDGEIVASALKVKVVADQPGADYNIGPANFTIPGFKGSSKFIGFYGKSDDSMAGGIIGKAKVVLSEDIEKAEEALAEELKREIKIAFEEQIPSDLKIIEESLKEETVRVSSTADKGEPADKFTVEVEAKVYALLFDEEELKEMVNFNLISMISGDKTPIPQSQRINWSELEIDWSKGEVSFPLRVEEDLAWKVDIQTLRSELAGQTEIEVRKYLASQPEIESAKVYFWPFWVKRVPLHTEKIKIIVDDYSGDY